ncbi:MAG TPA: PmoA family protein [Bacteroidales bacterium]|nr:PmoA family protein [Bacteroidales bacterium]
MKKSLTVTILTFGLIASSCSSESGKVEFVNKEQDKRVEVLIDGKLFTAFIYPENMEKQVLYPINTASGKPVTRGYPLEPRAFERTDHPHHVGLWLNFGDVNGLDFWNNSFAIADSVKHRYGSVKFNKIVSMDPSKGNLITSSWWEDINSGILLDEETSFNFSGDENSRIIERSTTLTAREQVTFTENKEGLLGLRVDRAFEEPSTQPEKFLDANGIETEVPVLNNEGVNGIYRNEEGKTGGDVWGKRSRWVALRAEKEGEIITIVIFDNPGNPNFPAWSHARGYGLFACNNLGGRAIDKTAGEVKIILQPGEKIVFKHKILITGDIKDEQINRMAAEFK